MEKKLPFKIERPYKRLFLGLLTLSCLCMAVLSWAVWRVTFLGLQEINEYLPMVFGIILAAVVMVTGLGILSMVAAIKGWGCPQLLQRKSYTLINMLFPLVVVLGKAFGYDKRKIEASFVAVSNQIIRNRHIRVPADKLLVVTPHCLQLVTCPHKITRDPNNCKRCGGCDIGALVSLAEEKGFHFFVVTGGTLARQTVKNIRPKVVLAIACERDLTSGIQDVYPLPAVGVMNIRPNGPCYNTHVDIEQVRKEIEAIIIPKDK